MDRVRYILIYMQVIVINTPHNVISFQCYQVENIPTSSNFTKENCFLYTFLQTNEHGKIENEEIELKPEIDTVKPPNPSEMRKAL